jgi:hypothetical protein
MSGLMILLFAQNSFLQSGERNPDRPPSTSRAEENSRFIVAFELSPEKGFTFTWPLESMRPAPYETVLMVVERMPRVLGEKSKGKRSEPLLASRHLKINGSFQKPLRSSRAGRGATLVRGLEQFLVKLSQGRLGLALSVPSGVSIDPKHQTARIKLYQLSPEHLGGDELLLLSDFIVLQSFSPGISGHFAK